MPFDLIAATVGLVLTLAVILEAWLTRYRGIYTWQETETNIGIAAGWLGTAFLFLPVTGIIYSWAYSHRAAEPGLVASFLLIDFLYYAYHVAGHKLHWVWASHSVHHSARRLNFLAGLRQPWTEILSGIWVLVALLGLAGVPALTVGYYFLASLLFQGWIHSEWAGRNRMLGMIFNTPSHHRVHHSQIREEMDSNYGSILIVWDRLFGTFRAEGAVPVTSFGMAHMPPPDAAPWTAAFYEWRRMIGRWSGNKASSPAE